MSEPTNFFDGFNVPADHIVACRQLYATCGLELILTCEAMPEQYDVLKDGKSSGYLRLRHGEFRVDYPECGDETIYEAQPNGDGIFEAAERMDYMAHALAAIVSKRVSNELIKIPHP